jgi:hypothetical protein
MICSLLVQQDGCSIAISVVKSFAASGFIIQELLMEACSVSLNFQCKIFSTALMSYLCPVFLKPWVNIK